VAAFDSGGRPLLSRAVSFLSLFFLSIAVGASHSSFAALSPAVSPNPPALTDSQRSSLRYRLENLFNSVDLTVRNHRSDELDLERQEQTAQYLKMYERIPFQPRSEEIRAQLFRSAEESGLKGRSFRFVEHPSEAPSIPAEIDMNEGSFRLSPEQVAESIRFRFVVDGEKNKVRDWILSWPENVMRLLEAEGGNRSPILQPLGRGRWEVEAWAFRFRNVRFPKLKIRNPRSLLPDWAVKHPALFAKQEPILWGLVEKAEDTLPQASAFLPIREKLLLNEARMSFFFIKAGATR
jgi:hypothetical protein